MNETLARILSTFTCSFDTDAQISQLAELLELSTEEALHVPCDPRLSYQPFTVRKRGGGRRSIVAPSGRLKLLQRRLLRQYLALQPVHDAATAFRPGRSVATHAERHLGQAIVLTVDLADFFPSTAARRLRQWFREAGWNDPALRILMRLCVYRGGLPQGAPTSPALSNLVNVELDARLSELASLHGARYSRYCDDLAFSCGTVDEPPAFRRQVEDILGRAAYRIQPAKGWRLQHAEHRPQITGIVLDGSRLRWSQRILGRFRRLKSSWFTCDATVSQQIQGYIGLRKMLRRKRRRR